MTIEDDQASPSPEGFDVVARTAERTCKCSGGRPLVSVIMPFLNEEKYLCDAVESVRAQSYSNWELLLVDDGSSDASTQLALGYAQREPARISYLMHEGHRNLGAGVSRNVGVRHSNGTLIAFLDADDFWLPCKLERQVPLMLAHSDAEMVYGNTLFWHAADHPDWPEVPDYLQYLGVRPNTLCKPPALLELLLRNEDIHPTTCSLMIRRRLFEEIGGFEETFEGMYEDTAFLAKIYLRHVVLVTGECSAAYRLHPESTCHLAASRGAYRPTEPDAPRAKFLRWLEAYLWSEDVTDQRVWRALRRELLQYDDPARYRRTQLLRRAARGARRSAARIARRILGGFGT